MSQQTSGPVGVVVNLPPVGVVVNLPVGWSFSFFAFHCAIINSLNDSVVCYILSCVQCIAKWQCF